MHLEFIPEIKDLPEDHVVLFFGKTGAKFIAVHGPKQDCLPQSGEPVMELWKATVTYFDSAGNEIENYPVARGLKQKHIGGMAEFVMPNGDARIIWIEAGGIVIAGINGSDFNKVYIAL